MRHILLGIIILLLFASCHKDNLSNNELIQGKWSGKVSIWKRTTSVNGSIISEGSDTTDWTKPDFTVSFNFKGDSLDFYYSARSYIMDLQGVKYIITANRLQFHDNPFSYSSSDPRFGLHPFLPPNQKDYCYISELTSNKLVLYDTDTINRNPLIVWQQWNTFVR